MIIELHLYGHCVAIERLVDGYIYEESRSRYLLRKHWLVREVIAAMKDLYVQDGDIYEFYLITESKANGEEAQTEA